MKRKNAFVPSADQNDSETLAANAESRIVNLLLTIAVCIVASISTTFAATKTAVNTGNWSSSSTWSPSGVPASTDDVIIRGGKVVTVDGIYTCRNLNVGDANSGTTTLRITTVGKSLTVTGALQMNPSNKNETITFDAGPGTVNINGTFSHWSTSGTNTIQIGTGTLNFTPAISISNDKQRITFTGAGTLNFNSDFTDTKNKLTTFSGCNVNFYGNYTVSSSASTWTTGSNANFYNTKTVTATKNIGFSNVNIIANAQTTFANATETITINGNLALQAFGTLTASKSFTIKGNISNDRGTISASGVTVTMDGTSQSINGPSAVSFGTLLVGVSSGSVDVGVTVNTNTTITTLTLSKANKLRTFNIASDKNVTVSGDLNFNQTGKDNFTQTVSVGSGALTVSGNLIFTGTSDNNKRKCRLTVGSGTLNLNGNITWMSNNSATTEEITVSSGTINFANSLSMANKSGTLSTTSVGTINFNGTSAPCYSFGGGSGSAAVFSTSSGSTINFNKGLTAASSLTFGNGSTAIFKTNATVTPTATINFYNLKIDTGITLTAAGNFSVKGNWINCGTFTPSTSTITFNGMISQNITRLSGSETFYRLTAATAANTIIMNNDVKITNTLTMSGSNIDMNGYTLTVGDNAAATLSRTLGQAYNGTWKRWFPASSITATSGSYHGLFPVGTSTQYRPVSISSSSSPSTAGYVSVVHTDAITVVPVSYTDNGGSNIEAIAWQSSTISTSGLAGGTYNLDVKYSSLGSAGSVSNLKLLTCTVDTVMGSHGTHATTLGPMNSPTAKRTGLSVSNLNNRWVVGTNNKAATPLYRYVYSRKSGLWGATDTWSYTEGGSGASCSCVPTSAGYAVINNGHNVTVFSSDSAIFVDVLSGGTLTVNIVRTLYVAGNVTLYGTGTFNTPGMLKVDGMIELSSSVTASGDVTAGYGMVVPAGVTYTQTSGSLDIGGDLYLDGTIAVSSGVPITLSGMATEIIGTGSITTAAGASISITDHKIIAAGSNITFGTSGANTHLAISSDKLINNLGTVTVNGNITGGNANSLWVNNAGSKLNIRGTLLTTGTLEATSSPNVVNYIGTGAQTIKIPYYTYNVLEASVSGTKTFSADIEVDSMVVLGGSALINESTYKLFGSGGLKMSGTSELRLQRSTDEDAYPELRGAYDLTGGTVTINQTGDSALVWGAEYYDLNLNGSRGYDISNIDLIKNDLDVTNTAWLNDIGNITIQGTLTHSTSGTSAFDDSVSVAYLVQSAGTINATDGIINITGASGWSKTAGTFNANIGTVMFSGSDNQVFSLNTAAPAFYNFRVDKALGTVTPGGSVTSLTLNGNMELKKGTMNLGSVTAITAKGNWTNDSAVFNPGASTITFSDSLFQLIGGVNTNHTFYNVTINKTAGELAVGGNVSSLNIDGNLTHTSGEFDNGTASDIYVKGNWSRASAATFAPITGLIHFNGSGAQAINGTATAHTFNGLRVNKASGTLSVSGSATSLTLSDDMILYAGTFDKGTANDIYVAGDWTRNSGTFTHGTGNVHFNGTDAQAINGTATSNTFYNMIVNNDAATLSLDDNDTLNIGGQLTLTSGRFFGGNSGVIRLTAGNWTNNGAQFLPSTSSVIFNSTSGAQAINGTAASQTFNNLIVSKSGQTLSVAGSTSDLNVDGNLTISAGTFDKGTATALKVGGNWSNSGTFTQGTGTVTFNGSGAQAISGSTTTTFYNLTINKSAEALTLNRAVNVSAALNLSRGIVNTSASNLLSLGASATATSGSATSFVAGPMKKTGNTDFTFPVGKDTRWRRVGVSGITNATTEVTAEYFGAAYANTTSLHADLERVSDVEYWDVNRSVTSDSLYLRFYWENASMSGINNCDFLTIAHFTGGQWIKEASATTPGSGCEGVNNGSMSTTSKIGSFSPFGFGSFGGGGSLPVTLTEIKATAHTAHIQVEWATATEINNKGFEVERSSDGSNFTNIGWVDGNGTTAENIRYTFDDKTALENTFYYYRLHQIDFDGASEYSPIVNAKINSSKVGEILWSRFIPNPASTEANLVMNVNAEGKAIIEIYNSFGQKVFETGYNIYHGLNNLPLDLSNLPAGNYITEIQLNGERKSVRLVRE